MSNSAFQPFAPLLLGALSLGIASCSSKVEKPLEPLQEIKTPVSQANNDSESRRLHFGAEVQRDAAQFSTLSADRRKTFEEEVGSALEIDVLSYDLNGRFDWDRKTLDATVDITLRREVGSGDHLLLDSAVESITRVSVDGVSLPFTVDSNLNKLIVPATHLPDSEEIVLSITYRAKGGNTLHVVDAREDDPIPSRVVYTTAEPLGASYWMPCHNTPADRAIFRTTFTTPLSERLIANGDLLSETTDINAGTRQTSYATRYSLPTYLMAFAAGEFQVTTLNHGERALPLSVWARKGLDFDAGAVLHSLARQVDHIESLLTPYPFEKYALVMLPQFPAGGLEHASVTFQAEWRTSEALNNRDHSLAAHELAHQWFGDYVTVASWDDLWVKEGMATLLAAELSRPFEDKENSRQLFGDFFYFREGEAIRDRELPPNYKYTSGPYARAAWFFTQLRSLLGETRFWGVMRQMLLDNPFGNVSTEDVFEAFQPHLSAAQLEAARLAVDNRSIPHFVSDENGYRLEDPGTSLVAGLEIRVSTAGGQVHSLILEGGDTLPRELVESSENTVVYDPRGAHPNLKYFGEAAPSLSPSELTAVELHARAPFGTVALRRALLRADHLLVSDDAEWQGLLGISAADTVDHLLLQRACSAIEKALVPADLAPVFAHTAAVTKPRGYGSSLGSLRGCLTEKQRVISMSHLEAAAFSGAGTETALARTQAFLAGSLAATPLWLELLDSANRLRLRNSATIALREELLLIQRSGETPTEEQTLSWAAHVNKVLSLSATREGYSVGLDVARIYGEVHPTARLRLESGLKTMLSKEMPPRYAKSAVCGSLQILSDEAVWREMLSAVADRSGAARAALDNANYCN